LISFVFLGEERSGRDVAGEFRRTAVSPPRDGTGDTSAILMHSIPLDRDGKMAKSPSPPRVGARAARRYLDAAPMLG
jgi:hypothetical protein